MSPDSQAARILRAFKEADRDDREELIAILVMAHLEDEELAYPGGLEQLLAQLRELVRIIQAEAS